MIHSAASVILNQVILLTLSLKVLLAALVHWFFLCPCAFFQTEKFLRFIVAENEKSCQRLWDYICGGCAKADTRVVVETTAGLKTSHFFGNFGKFWPRCALVVVVAVHSIVYIDIYIYSSIGRGVVASSCVCWRRERWTAVYDGVGGLLAAAATTTVNLTVCPVL